MLHFQKQQELLSMLPIESINGFWELKFVLFPTKVIDSDKKVFLSYVMRRTIRFCRFSMQYEYEYMTVEGYVRMVLEDEVKLNEY
jgi:hypothetical protein